MKTVKCDKCGKEFVPKNLIEEIKIYNSDLVRFIDLCDECHKYLYKEIKVWLKRKLPS